MKPTGLDVVGMFIDALSVSDRLRIRSIGIAQVDPLTSNQPINRLPCEPIARIIPNMNNTMSIGLFPTRATLANVCRLRSSASRKPLRRAIHRHCDSGVEVLGQWDPSRTLVEDIYSDDQGALTTISFYYTQSRYTRYISDITVEIDVPHLTEVCFFFFFSLLLNQATTSPPLYLSDTLQPLAWWFMKLIDTIAIRNGHDEPIVVEDGDGRDSEL